MIEYWITRSYLPDIITAAPAYMSFWNRHRSRTKAANAQYSCIEATAPTDVQRLAFADVVQVAS